MNTDERNEMSTDATYRDHDGLEIAGILLGALDLNQRADEARCLARQLDRKGGGFTKHASATLRAKADHWDRNAKWAREVPTA